MTVELLRASFTEIVATVCAQVGFEKVNVEAVDILADILHKYLSTLSEFIAALGEDSYFGLLDGVTTLEVLDQPLESLLTFADEVGAYMPRPVPTKCLPLYAHDRLQLPPKEQYALTALQLSLLPPAPSAVEEKPVVKTVPKPADLTLPSSALKGPCQQNLPPWASRVSYRLTRVTYDPVTKRLSEHEPPTPIAIDSSSSTSLAHRRSTRPSTSAFRRSSTVTPQLGSPTHFLSSASPRRNYNSKDAWNAALQAMPSPGAPSGHAQSPRVSSPSISEKMSPHLSSQTSTPNSTLLTTSATKLASSRAAKRAFRNRKRRPSFGRKRPPASKRFALTSTWNTGPSSVPPVPEAAEEEEKEVVQKPIAIKMDDSDEAYDGGGLKPADARTTTTTPPASCHSSSPDSHQPFGFSPDSSPSDLNYGDDVFHRKDGGDNTLPAETTLTPKLPSPASPTSPVGITNKSPVTSPVRPMSPVLSATDRLPATPRTPKTPDTATTTTKDRLKLSPPASSPPPARSQRSETAATPTTETKPRSTRASESRNAALLAEQTKNPASQRPFQSKPSSSKKKPKKTQNFFPSRETVMPKRRLPDSKNSTVASKCPPSPLSGNDLSPAASPSACSDSNTEPMADRERSADFEMPQPKTESTPQPRSPERHVPATPQPASMKPDPSSANLPPQLPPPRQTTFLSGAGTTEPTVLHFPPTKRPRSRTSSSLSSLSSRSSSSSSSSSPSSGSSSILSPLPPQSPGRGFGPKPAPAGPPPPLSSLTCLSSQAPATVCRGPAPGPPPPSSLSPIPNPRALESSAPSLVESDDDRKTPQAKQTPSSSSPATRTLSSISQREPPSPLSISSLPEPESRFNRLAGTATTPAPLTPASVQPHGGLRIKIRLGADAASCHSSDGPPTETTDMLSRSSVSPFAALRAGAASTSSSASSSSSSSSPSSSPSRHSSDEDLDQVARRHAAIPPSLQVIRRPSPAMPSSQRDSHSAQSSSAVPPVAKAPKLVIRFGNSESNVSIVRSVSPSKPPLMAESAAPSDSSSSAAAQQPPPVLPPLHLSLSAHHHQQQPFSHHRRAPDRLRGSSISSLSASSSPSSTSSSSSSAATSGLNSSDGLRRMSTTSSGSRHQPPPPPPSLDRLPTRSQETPASSSLGGGGADGQQSVPPPPQLEVCPAAGSNGQLPPDLGWKSSSSSALPSLPPLLPLLPSSSSTSAAPITKSGDGEPRSSSIRSHSRHSSKHRRSSRHRGSASHKSQKELTAPINGTSGGGRAASPLPSPPVLDVLPPPPVALTTASSGLSIDFLRPTGRRARVDSVFTDDEDDDDDDEIVVPPPPVDEKDDLASKTFKTAPPSRSAAAASSLSSSNKKHGASSSRKSSATTDASPASVGRSSERGRSKKTTTSMLPPPSPPSKPPQQVVSGPSTTQVMSSSAGTSYYFNNNGEQIWLCPICLSEDDGNLMVGCDSCDDWYHSGCLGLAKEPDAAQWFCPKCSGEPLPPLQPRASAAVLLPPQSAASPVRASSPHHSLGSRKAKTSTTGVGGGSKRAKGLVSAKKRSLL